LVASTSFLAIGLSCSGHAPAPVTRAPPVGCKEPELKVVVRGSDRLNMDEFGQSLAVVVRVYQLKTSKTIEDAEFDQIWQHDRETLSDDVLSAVEMTLAPSDSKIVNIKRAEDARYLAVIGLFRKPDGIAWRAIRLIPTICKSGAALKNIPKEIAVEFLVEDYRIEVRT
jgi:type VI secretion system VasD/TssJ family lipoprotein